MTSSRSGREGIGGEIKLGLNVCVGIFQVGKEKEGHVDQGTLGVKARRQARVFCVWGMTGWARIWGTQGGGGRRGRTRAVENLELMY